METENTAPESKILINDAELPPELHADLLDVVVCQHSNGPASFDFTLSIVGTEHQELRWVDDARLQPGNKLEIRVGYLDRLENLISGEITALHPKYSAKDSAKMHVQGFDRLHRLGRGKKTRSFLQVKDSQIAQTMAADHGLSVDAEDTSVVFDYLLQNNQSDLEFLLERARRIRYEARVEGQKLVFRRAQNHLGAKATLEYAKTLKHFSPRLSTIGQVDELSVLAWSSAKKEAAIGRARVGAEDSRMGGERSGPEIARAAFGKRALAVVDAPLATQAEADQMAHALYNERALEFVCGEGEAVGDVAIRAGSTVELKGLGQRFGGTYYVKRAEHRLSAKTGYVTRFELSRGAA
jgi:phage protein D